MIIEGKYNKEHKQWLTSDLMNEMFKGLKKDNL